MTTRSSRLPRWLAVALAAAWLSVLMPPPVAAHAEIASSDPAANATLTEAPQTLRIEFTEAIDPDAGFVHLLDPEQRSIEGVGALEVAGDGRSVTVDLPELDPGVYTVSWQVVSTVDGHATAGIFAFLVDPTGAQAPPAVPASSSSPSINAWSVSARWVALAAILVALGSLIMWWHAGRSGLAAAGLPAGPPWLFVAISSATALAGLALYLVLAAQPIADTSGTARGALPFDIVAPFGWTPFAIAMRVALLACLAAAVAALVGRRRSGSTRLALATAAMLLLGVGGMSMAGHAAATGGPAFAALDSLHLVAAAAWLGGLPAAVLLAARGRTTGSTGATLRAILRGHGRLALVAAPLVLLTGLANSPLVLGARRGLVGSDYGNLLLAKAVLLSVALGIGAANHLLLRGRGRAALGALLTAEMAVAALAVMAAATMVTIQPASARQEVLTTPPLNPAHLYGIAGPSRIHATVSLARPGPQSYQVTVTDATSGQPRDDVQKVFLSFTPPADADLPAERVELAADETYPGLYATTGAYTPVVGDWDLDVVVRRRGAVDESASFTLPVIEPAPPELAPPPDTGIGVPAPLGALWGILPAGAAGWIPALVALVALGATWLLRGRVPLAALRGALAVAFLAAALGAGSRSLVDAANAPTAAELASAAPPPAEEGAVARGEELYLANCASCHGRDGRGEGPVDSLPPAGPLPAAVRTTSDAALAYRIANGIAGTDMPAFAGTITERERSDLVRYLRDRWGGP